MQKAGFLIMRLTYIYIGPLFRVFVGEKTRKEQISVIGVRYFDKVGKEEEVDLLIVSRLLFHSKLFIVRLFDARKPAFYLCKKCAG